MIWPVRNRMMSCPEGYFLSPSLQVFRLADHQLAKAPKSDKPKIRLCTSFISWPGKVSLEHPPCGSLDIASSIGRFNL